MPYFDGQQYHDEDYNVIPTDADGFVRGEDAPEFETINGDNGSVGCTLVFGAAVLLVGMLAIAAGVEVVTVNGQPQITTIFDKYMDANISNDGFVMFAFAVAVLVTIAALIMRRLEQS